MNATRQERPTPAAHRPRLLPAVLAGCLGALALAALLLAGVVPALTGARPVAVQTGEPSVGLAAGSLAVVRPGVARAGEVVAVAEGPGERPGLRKVLAVSDDEVLLNSPDGTTTLVEADLVEGVYLYAVPWAGALWTGAATPAGMLFVAAGLLLLVAGHQLRSAQRHGQGYRSTVGRPLRRAR